MGRIQAETRNLHDILYTRNRLKHEVPPFQRYYSWGKEEVREFVEDLIENTRKGEGEYYIGAMVFLRKQQSGNNIEYLIVDGQQRLITTIIYLTAIRNYIRERIENIENTNDTSILDDLHYIHRAIEDNYLGNEDRGPAIVPSNLDRDCLFKILREPNFTEQIKHDKRNIPESWRKMIDAYNICYGKVEETLSESTKERLGKEIEALSLELLPKIGVVSIYVNNEEDAYLIFETLNSRGVQLAPFDLIKNLLMSKLNDEKDIYSYQARLERLTEQYRVSEITEFIRYYLIAKNEEFVKKKELFRYVKNKIKTVEHAKHLLKDIDIAEKLYRNIMKPNPEVWDDEYTSWMVKSMNDLRHRQHNPILFKLQMNDPRHQKNKIKKKKMIDWIKPLYFTILRRIVAGKSPSQFEKKIVDLVEFVGKGDYNTYIKTLRVLLPSDDEVRDVLMKLHFNNKKSLVVAKNILMSIEFHYTYISDDDKVPGRDLTLEHIAPRSSKEYRNEKHLLGNFTLLKGSKNKKLSSRSPRSKISIYERSKLMVNTKFLVDKYDLQNKKWTKNLILDRTKLLAEEFCKISKV